MKKELGEQAVRMNDAAKEVHCNHRDWVEDSRSSVRYCTLPESGAIYHPWGSPPQTVLFLIAWVVRLQSFLENHKPLAPGPFIFSLSIIAEPVLALNLCLKWPIVEASLVAMVTVKPPYSHALPL